MLRRRHTALVVAIALIVCASAAAHPTQSAGLPTVADARTIVNTLWTMRETAFAAQDTARIDAIETASARQLDDAYLGWIACKCDPPKAPLSLGQVIPQIPRGSAQPFFLAQVRTTDEVTRRPVWHVVAVERDASGTWKLAFVSWGSYKAAPPLQSVTRSSGYTAAVTAQAHARMIQLAVATAADISARTPHLASTSWGATIHQRI